MSDKNFGTGKNVDIDVLEKRLNHYLLIGAGDTTDEAVEGNNLAMDSRAAIRDLRLEVTRLTEALRQAALDLGNIAAMALLGESLPPRLIEQMHKQATQGLAGRAGKGGE